MDLLELDALVKRSEVATAKVATIPNAGRFAQGRHGDGALYNMGLVVTGTPNVGLISTSNFDELHTGSFLGWSPKAHHYCPQAPWSEWVTLARNILAIDSAIYGGKRG